MGYVHLNLIIHKKMSAASTFFLSTWQLKPRSEMKRLVRKSCVIREKLLSMTLLDMGPGANRKSRWIVQPIHQDTPICYRLVGFSFLFTTQISLDNYISF